MRDIEGLKSQLSILEVVRRHGVDLKKAGSEWEGLCPFHDEKTPSFRVIEKKGFFNCHGCGVNGDQIDFVRLFNGFGEGKDGFKESADKLAEIANFDLTINDVAKSRVVKEHAPEAEDIWKTVPVAGPWEHAPGQTVELFNPKRENTYAVNYAAAYEYFHPTGELAGVILRSESGGKKQFQTITYRTSNVTGEARWVVLAMDAPRPVLGGPEIMGNAKAKILLVEGEKARLSAERLVGSPKLIVVTWAGGSKAVEKTDWSVLAGRDVIGWPDADSQKHKRGEREGEYIAYHEQGGMAAMLKIAELSGANMRIVRIPGPGQVESGWDLADAEAEGWDRARVFGFIKENSAKAGEIIPATADPGEYYPEPLDQDLVSDAFSEDEFEDGPAVSSPELGDGDRFDDGVIRFLGWDNGRAFYLPHGFKQVVSLAAGGHTKLQLLQLAPASYWAGNFISSKKGGDGVDWDLAADSLMRRSQAKGVFDSKMIRGRGAWFDSGRSVVHAGDSLVVDGEVQNLNGINSKYIYQLAKPLDITLGEPLQSSDAVKFAQLCDMIRWEDPISSRLLAGWCFLAPICGAIEWRPHLWLTGPAGSGKSTILKRIMRASLGSMFIHAAGDTTEAGLRQRLRQDALPVLFDEFESEREKAAQKTQDVLALVRQSSSDTGAEIIKGGANGTDDSYLIRSMFAFASISVNLGGQADESRVTVLSMKGATKEEQLMPDFIEHWIKFQKMLTETMTEEFIQRLQARSIRMIPTIRQNIQSFSDAIAQSPAMGGRRLGDQVGTLLAGAYSLYSNKPIDLDGALAWIASQDWSAVSNTEADGDERNCIVYIMSHAIRVEGHAAVQTLTVAELIDIAAGIEPNTDNIDGVLAGKTLQRIGMKVLKFNSGHHELHVSQAHKKIEEILKGSGYAGWGRIMLRLPGAKKLPNTVRFAGVVSRAISVPLEVIRDVEGSE